MQNLNQTTIETCLADSKFLRKFEKAVRYNPDPLSMQEPMMGEKVSPGLMAVVKDKHFARTMKNIGLYNAMLDNYENHIWQFQFRFADDYRFGIKISKYLGKETIVFEQAVHKALGEALYQYSAALSLS